MIDDRVAGDLKNPALELCFVLQGVGPGMNLEEHVLQDVVGRGGIMNPLENEPAQTLLKGAVEGIRCVGCMIHA